MKERYIDLMELVMSAYSDEDIKRYTKTVLENGIELSAVGQGDLRILLPVFEFDGEKRTV